MKRTVSFGPLLTKVYIVMVRDEDEAERGIHAVFATRELAEDRVDTLLLQSRDLGDDAVEDIRVDEWDVQ